MESLLSQGFKIGKDGLEQGMDTYVQCMEEITKRSVFIQQFYDVSIDRFQEPVVAETIGLQLRNTLELIAKASLVAHQAVLADVSLWFKKDWHAGEILSRIEQVNPHFYPHPIRESRVYETGTLRAEWEDVPDGIHLTRERFIEAYSAIGEMMHAHSPTEEVAYREFLAKTIEWDSQIHELLSMHQIRLLGADSFCLVQMNVDGVPKWSPWARIERTGAKCDQCGQLLFKSNEALHCPSCMQTSES